MTRSELTRQDIERYLGLLSDELAANDISGEIILVGGAFMLLVIGSREVTRDVDAYFGKGAQAIRQAAAAVAEREGLAPDWINDAAKGFMYSQPPSRLWLELPALKIYSAGAEYVLAMKAVAARAAAG